MFYLSRLRLSASFRLSRLFVCSSLRVFLVRLSLRLSASFYLFVFPRLSYLSTFSSSVRLFLSLISSSLPLVPVDRSLPSPWLGYSHLHGSATPVSVLLSKSLLKTTTYISRRNN